MCGKCTFYVKYLFFFFILNIFFIFVLSVPQKLYIDDVLRWSESRSI